MNPHHDLVPNSTEIEVPLPTVTEDELKMLVDVLEHPYAGVVERYKRLGVSRRKGNDWKETCLLKDLVKPVDICLAALEAKETTPMTPTQGD